MRFVRPGLAGRRRRGAPGPDARLHRGAHPGRRRRRTHRERHPRHPLRQDRLRLGHRRQRHLPAPPGGDLHREKRLRGAHREDADDLVRPHQRDPEDADARRQGGHELVHLRVAPRRRGQGQEAHRLRADPGHRRGGRPALVGGGRRPDQRGRGGDPRDPGARPAAAGGDHRGLRARHRDHHLADGALVGGPRARSRPPDGGIQEVRAALPLARRERRGRHLHGGPRRDHPLDQRLRRQGLPDARGGDRRPQPLADLRLPDRRGAAAGDRRGLRDARRAARSPTW